MLGQMSFPSRSTVLRPHGGGALSSVKHNPLYLHHAHTSTSKRIQIPRVGSVVWSCARHSYSSKPWVYPHVYISSAIASKPHFPFFLHSNLHPHCPTILLQPYSLPLSPCC